MYFFLLLFPPNILCLKSNNDISSFIELSVWTLKKLLVTNKWWISLVFFRAKFVFCKQKRQGCTLMTQHYMYSYRKEEKAIKPMHIPHVYHLQYVCTHTTANVKMNDQISTHHPCTYDYSCILIHSKEHDFIDRELLRTVKLLNQAFLVVKLNCWSDDFNLTTKNAWLSSYTSTHYRDSKQLLSLLNDAFLVVRQQIPNW